MNQAAKLRHRYKLVSVRGGSLIDPVVKHTPFRWWNAAGALSAFALQGVALFVAPYGEKDD